MFEDKKITKEKVKDLLYALQNEFDNELDFEYTSDYKKEITNDDLNMLVECIERFVHKVELTIDDELCN